MKKQYYSMATTGDVATINIYGDICSWAWEELGEVSAYNLSKQLDELTGVSQIDVYINSYGGEVAEGLAIYNALKRKAKSAKVTTYCDGFACSIASVIFMAGSERKMSKASLLMIHNAWTIAEGDAAALRKLADDMEIITSASVAAYMEVANISEVKLRHMMNKETWLTPENAVEIGFATSIVEETVTNASQNARKKLFELIMAAEKGEGEEEPEEEEEAEETGSEEDADPEEEEENPENEEDTPETSETEEETEVEEEEEDPEKGEKKENPSEKVAGFFNAIFKF